MWMAIMFFCSSCIVGSREAVLASFPSVIQAKNIRFFHTVPLGCTFAAVEIGPTYIPTELLRATQHNLDLLRERDSSNPNRQFMFPEGGYAYFPEQSVLSVSSLIYEAGDEGLGSRLGDQFSFGRSCLGELGRSGGKIEPEELQQMLDDTVAESGIVVIGEQFWPKTIVLFPERLLAYYLGP
jgi:hypothetical protein